MRIAVFGIGGVGGIVGGALAKTHPDTNFFVRGENLKAIMQHGLKVQSVLLGDFVAHPRLASDNPAKFGIMDVIFVSCKGYHLKSACEAISQMTGPETIVIPLLNGLLVSDIMEPMLPPCILADGAIYVFTRLEKPGHIVHSAGLCSITFGMKDGGKPAKFEEIAAILNKANIKTTLSGNIMLDSWLKYIRMCCNSAMFCYYDGPAGKIHEDPNHEKALRSMLAELIAVATAKGVALPADMIDQYVSDFSKLPPDTVSSLYRDLNSGKPANETELHHIIGRMVEFGRQVKVATPYHQTVYERFLSKR